MPLDPTRTHTYSVRRPKTELQLLRDLAARLGTSPSRLINEAFQHRLPALMRKAGLSPKKSA